MKLIDNFKCQMGAKANNLNVDFISTILFLIIAAPLILSSCKKFVQVNPPKNEITTSEVFSSDATATSAVLGIYIKIMSSGVILFGNSGITIYTGLSSDELSTTTGNTDEIQFNANTLTSSNVTNQGLWAQAYSYIYQTNACIEGLQQSTAIDTPTRNQLIGECEVVRSLCYFNLVNLYESVPLELTSNYLVNDVLARTSVDSVYQQIIQDLSGAQTLMSSTYISAGKLRPNAYTATALLAKAYLYKMEWDSAEAAATRVISSGMYSLDTLNGVFLANSNEAIWQLSPVQPGYETNEGSEFIPKAHKVPNYPITESLVAAFEPGDQRLTDWIGSDVASGQTYYYPYKYKLGHDENTTPLEDYMIFRLGEQYLIRAEAEAELKDLNDAKTDLNIIRSRAGLPNTVAQSQSDLISAIQHERQVELFCECGNRWFDLKRTGLTNSVLSADKSTGWLGANASLYPIPVSELMANPFLTQNAGY